MPDSSFGRTGKAEKLKVESAKKRRWKLAD
jgi:hypothetical protein